MAMAEPASLTVECTQALKHTSLAPWIEPPLTTHCGRIARQAISRHGHSDAEIEKRLPVWHALSDVFLDTKLSDEDYTEIAAALRNSAYSRILLKEIFEDEVHPPSSPICST